MSNDDPAREAPDRELVDSLISLGLVQDPAQAWFEPLTGGVSSDIWKVTEAGRSFCVKRALAKLKVAADWFAPVERNRFEVAWYSRANRYVPGAAPKILAEDQSAKLCAMSFLDPDQYKLWKSELRDGRADPAMAAQVGRFLAQIHARSAADPTVGEDFPRADIFKAIRLEPYLEATADRHPDLKEHLFALSRRTGEMRLAMIHGDVSPKNILIGPDGPIFLDAECACIGDPAFDLAFCLNHFLLKCLWVPSVRDEFLACFQAMTAAYLAEVTWEDPSALEARAASLLPGLFLARVDGKSPVEYLTDAADQDRVRRCARALLKHPPKTLETISAAWREEISE